MTKGRLFSVTGQGSAPGIHYVKSVLIALIADMGMPEKNDITAVGERKVFQPVQRAAYTVKVTVCSKYLMLKDRKYKNVITEAIKVAVACNVYYLWSKLLVRQDEIVQLMLAVAKVDYPVGIGITENYTFKIEVITMCI